MNQKKNNERGTFSKSSETEINKEMQRKMDVAFVLKENNTPSSFRTSTKRYVSTAERTRNPSLTVPRFKTALDNFSQLCLQNKEIPMDDQFRELDGFRYDSLNLIENRPDFEKQVQICEKELDTAARLQTAIDFFDRVKSIPPKLGVRPLTTIDVPPEKREEYLRDYLNGHLSLEEKERFEENILGDLKMAEKTYLKEKLEINESTLLRQKQHFLVAHPSGKAFDSHNVFYNRITEYESMAWAVVMVTGLFTLFLILKKQMNRKSK
jgi:hypothetical protein